jgi:predicted TIM-barrel fold metal-dependent hydrolase
MSSQSVSRFQDIGRVVDLDFHLVEEEAALVPYLEEPFEDMLTRPGVGEPQNYNETKFLIDGIDGDMGPDVAVTPDDVKEVMAEMGIDRVTLNPGLNLNLVTVTNDRYALALASAYNEWVTENVFDASEGLYGTIRLCLRDPARAVAEIERWTDTDGVVGAMLGPPGFRSPLGDPRFDPVYDALEDAGLPLLLHNSVLSLQHVFPAQFDGFNTFMEARAFGHPSGQMMHFTRLLVNGVPERYPDLDFVMMESGLGWIPYMMRRLDYYYSSRREDAPHLTRPPSEYVDTNFSFTTQPIEGTDDPAYVQQVVEWIGPEILVFASDYPHSDFDFADALYRTLRDGFDRDDIEGIYGGNATEILNY